MTKLTKAKKSTRIVLCQSFMKQFFDNCKKFMQFLLPQNCLLCDAHAGKELLCAACRNDLPRHNDPACPVCAHPSPQWAICGACLKNPPAFDATHAVFIYDFPLDALLKNLKYGGNLVLADFFAEAMLAHLPATRPDVLIPMPLHPQRLKERGFNQSLEIARRLSQAWEIPLVTAGVTRTRHSEPQASLPLAKRAANVRGIFTVSGDFEGKSILLVDDILTSGASLNELAKTLKKAGANRVECLVAARTLPHHV